MSDDTRERSRHADRDVSAPPNGSDGNPDMFQPDGHLNAEMVSAWLDTPEDFDTDQRAAIEAHLAECAQCSQVAAELTAIVRAFQQLPLVDAPRSFALTPEMAGLTPTPTLPSSRQVEPVNLRDRARERDSRPAARDYPVAYPAIPWYERQMSALRWATAVATLLFVFIFSADLLGNIDTTGGSDDDSAMIAEESLMTGASEATAAGGAAMPEDDSATDDGDDVARSALETPGTEGDVADEEAVEEEAAEDAASGELAETEATGGGSSGAPEPTGAIEEEQEAPPATNGDEPASNEAETMMTIPTEEAAGSDQEAFVPQDGPTIAQYNAEQAAEDGESNVLHILELALVTIIAWLLVAMIALPRLRRPGA